MNRTEAITKTLSRNDTAETGGHQGGILIPKDKEILSFFPSLDEQAPNPRKRITFHDSLGNKWEFSLIHYNNRLIGGTRNEYRLTGMTRFLRSVNAKAGDYITLRRNDDGFYSINYVPSDSNDCSDKDRLILGNSWKVIKIKS